MNVHNPNQWIHMSCARRRLLQGLSISAILVVVWTLRSHFGLVVVVGSSMNPTFQHGDVVIVHKRSYQDRSPERGDIVIARQRNDRVLKRIVGMPGEDVEIREGTLWVGGATVQEDYVVSKGLLFVGKGKLAPDRFGLTGDNRNSPDSTTALVAKKGELVGKVVACVFRR